MERKTITSEDLLLLEVGSKTRLQCRDGKHCESVTSLAYRIPKRFPNYKNRHYRCCIDWKKSIVEIEVLDIGESRKKKSVHQ